MSGHARMARIGLLDGIHREDTDRVDAHPGRRGLSRQGKLHGGGIGGKDNSRESFSDDVVYLPLVQEFARRPLSLT